LRHTSTGAGENKSWLEANKNRWELFDKTAGRSPSKG
jgi:hypothetical protein